MKINFLKLTLILILVAPNRIQAQTWKEINPPPNIFNDGILSIASDTTGNLYAAGKFKNARNEFIVAKWDGSNWAELGSGSSALKANNVITCLVTDKGGNLYAAGGFTNSSGNYYIAKWNGTSWSEVGGPDGLRPNNLIYAMTMDDSANVYVAGGFTNAGDRQYVAKWNGASWTELGLGTNSLGANGLIYSLTAQGGSVYAAGHFTDSNGKYYVAKWNGTNWSELGGAGPLNANDYINCIKTDNAGNVYAAGAFKNSVGDYYVAKWNGSNWAEIGAGANELKANGPFNALGANAAGDIYAGGFGTNFNGNTNLVRWNGSNWTQVFEVGYSANNAIRAICFDYAGAVYAAGDFQNNGGHTYVAKWDGNILSEPGRNGDNLNANNGIYHLAATPKGEVYAVGAFTNKAGNEYIAHWDGRTWSQLGADTALLNVNHYLFAMTTDPLGNLYASGDFTNQNGKYYIARWDGHSWSGLGTSSHPLKVYAPITLLTSDKAGNIYAAGDFGDSTGFGPYIMKWNGSDWSLFPSPYGSNCSLFVDASGTIYAGIGYPDIDGYYSVEKIDQNGTTILGTGNNALKSRTKITALAVDGQGNVLASGLNNAGFSPYNKFVAKWDGTTWSIAGSDSTSRYADGYVTSMLADDSGYVYAASATAYNSYFSVAKWDGNNWSQLGIGPTDFNSGLINKIVKDSKGNIYAAGLFGYVAVYGRSALTLQQPSLKVSPNQYCKVTGVQTIKILNLPDTFFISASARLDDTQLTISPDSSIVFNPSTLATGNHRIKVTYSTRTDSMFVVKDFAVITPATPDVNVTASTTTVTDANPVTITAVNASGGGTIPKFTFAKDRTITTILQAESTNNTFSLDPAVLAPGENRIYVKMKSSDSCVTTPVNIDSVTITKPVSTGIIDVDYPNQEVLVYPNPFVETFTITGLQSGKSYTISLSNSIGQIVSSRAIRNVTHITIKQKAPFGNYWLTIYDNSKNRLLGSVLLIKR